MYLAGGVLFTTSRILVMDLLTKRVPTDFVSGIVVCNAHRVSPSSSEAFILRLYRHANRDGFVKALTDAPEALASGFAGAEKTLRALWLRKLFLWCAASPAAPPVRAVPHAVGRPRFHRTVAEALDQSPPVVHELRVPLTPAMRRVQLAVEELIMSCLRELRKTRVRAAAAEGGGGPR